MPQQHQHTPAAGMTPAAGSTSDETTT